MNKKEIEKIKKLKKEAWANRQRYTGKRGASSEQQKYFAYHFGEFEAYKSVLLLTKKK